MAADRDVPPQQYPLAKLEQLMIDDYLLGAGFEPAEVRARDDEAARQLLRAASEYAAGRLTEVESRLHYLRSLRGQE
jgi:hypothetical protein